MKKKRRNGVMRRLVSSLLALTLVLTSIQITVMPGEEVKAASAEGMGDSELLSATHVPDSEVRNYYTILANAQKNLEVAQKKEDSDAIDAANQVLEELSEMNAGAVKAAYGNKAAYTEPVYGRYLTSYPGKIDFAGITVSNIEGIGWARAAKEFDLSGVNVTEIPASEFAYCKMTKISLPASVTKIGDNAFNTCTNLVTLKIGSSAENVVDLTKVNEIGKSAFSGCNSITTVKFADYDSSSPELKIGTSAFASCQNLTEVKVPIKTASNLGANAFEQCAKLTKVGLHNDLTYLSNGLFQGAGAAEYSIKFYVIENGEEDVSRLPGKITYIGNSCFQDSFLWKMDLTNCQELKKLNQNSFARAVISDLSLPDSLEEIETHAFQAAVLSSIVIPEKCVTIGGGAFYNSYLGEITLPDNLTKIEEETFKGCKYLQGEKIHLSSNSKLETIGNFAFSDCERLGTTSFLAELENLTTIGTSAFSDCYLYIKYNNSNVMDGYGELLVVDGLKEIVLPDSVVTLGESVFSENYALRKADLGVGVTNIPDKAFYNASKGGKLETVVVSDQLQNIGKSAFENQTRLFSVGYTNGTTSTIKEGTVQFSNSLLAIGERAFAGCGVRNRVSVSGVKAYALKTDVKEAAEAGLSEFLIYDYEGTQKDTNYCRSIYIDESNLIAKSSLPEGVLDDSGKLTDASYIELNIVAKKAYLDLSKTTEVKGDGDKTIEVYSEYETDTEAYKGRLYAGESHLSGGSTRLAKSIYCTTENADSVVSNTEENGKTAMYIKATVSSDVANVKIQKGEAKNINLSYMFGIQKVTLPDSMREDSLGASAFLNCINLDRVTLSENLTQIKDSTFSGCGGEIENALDSSDKYYDYYGLRTIYIPDGMEIIGNNAFQNCSNLFFQEGSSSALGIRLESIGNNAFMGCYSLETMKFPTSLKSIGSSAFAQCAILNTGDKDYKKIASGKDSSGNDKTYNYYWNYEKYGTKTEKTGLRKLDFTAAKNLESIGKSAFKQTNVTDIQLTNSPLKKIPDNLFEQCSYLQNVAFHDNVESVGNNVLKDTPALSVVTIPASATMSAKFISGAFGAITVDRITSLSQADPVLNFSYKENEEIVVPINSSLRLPINVFNKDVLDGVVKIVVVDDQGNETNILNTGANGLRAEVDTTTNPYSFILYGEEYLKEPVTVKIEAGIGFSYADFANNWLSSHTFTYKVTVDDVPTESVSLSVSEDTYVKNNPEMYEDNGSKKALYIPVKSSAATNGVKLTASINPAETTDDVSWESSNPEVVEVVPGAYTKGSGVATAVIKVKQIGDATVTVKSGKKTDVIYVTGQIPVASSGGLVCSTGGTLLDTNLKSNSSNNPYVLSIGDSDKINVTVDYGNTDYDENQLNNYGEKAVIKSSDESVIVVDPDGTFRAVGEGTAVITVSGQASGTKMQFYIEVTDGANYEPYSVTVSGASEVNIGESISLSASVAPVKASQAVKWSVASGANNVSIDENGNVTGLAKGDATIVATASAKNTVKSTPFKVTVKAPAKEFRILDSNVSLEVGRTYAIAKTTNAGAAKGFFVSPTDTTDKIEWRSSNEGILQVANSNAQNVTIKAIAVGSAELIGTTSSGASASLTVNVIQKTNSITVDKEVTLNVGKTHQLNPQKVPATSNENLTFTYTSGNPKVATVDANGVIRAVSPGSAVITVKTDTGKAANCAVTVKQPASKITLYLNRPSTKTVYLAKGQTLTLNTKLAPENTTDKLTYKSSKAKVAEVTASGVVTAKNKGTATVTVKADSGKKLSVKVVVSKKQVKAKKVKIKAPKTVKRKKTIKISVSLKSAKSTDTLSFTSNKPKVAEIDAYGYLKAKKKGTVKITVTASSGKKATKTIKVK